MRIGGWLVLGISDRVRRLTLSPLAAVDIFCGTRSAMISVGFEWSSGATYADWRLYFENSDNFIAVYANAQRRFHST